MVLIGFVSHKDATYMALLYWVSLQLYACVSVMCLDQGVEKFESVHDVHIAQVSRTP